MWIAIALISTIIALIAISTNVLKDDEIKTLQYKIGYLEGKTDSAGNKRYK